MAINRYNFFRWNQEEVPLGDAPSDYFSDEFSSEFTQSEGGPVLPVLQDVQDLPRAYQRDRRPYMPVLVEGDVLGFYINTPRGINVGSFSDLGLRFIREDGALATSGFTVLYRDQISAQNYNIYALFDVPALAPGIYRMQIFRLSDGVGVLTSNPLLARTDSEVNSQTAVFRFKNDRFFYGIRYGRIPGFYQSVRLNVSVSDRQQETDKESYTGVTSGKQRTFNNSLKRFYRFETYYFDPMAHEAAAVMIEHDYLEINGMVFRHKTPYKETVDPMLRLTKGEFEMYDEAFGTINRTTVAPTLVLGDGYGAVLLDGQGNAILVR